MAIEQLQGDTWHMSPGIFDAHGHARIFDAITDDVEPWVEGKAGLRSYTEAALAAGITVMATMPNESLRKYFSERGASDVVPYPISNIDRVLAAQSAVSHEAVEPVGIIFGQDPTELVVGADRDKLDTNLWEQHCYDVHGEVGANKYYAADTQGGYNIPVHLVAPSVQIAYESNPGIPHIIHVEGLDVGRVLDDIYHLPGGKDIPVDIAHVSSIEELDAVIYAKELKMNVQAELTPHHMTLDETVVAFAGNLAEMKPRLKPRRHVEYIRARMKYIDRIGSDCAPHREQDKLSAKPSPGVANHTMMLPVALSLVAAGVLTMEQLYQKMCVGPRERFNLPADDNSYVVFKYEDRTDMSAEDLDKRANVRYGQNVFRHIPTPVRIGGYALEASAGKSHFTPDNPQFRTSYTHLVRPQQQAV